MKSHRRSPCPVACTLDLVGDKWTLLVVRDLACGKTSFKEFSASPERIATNILSDRLAKLVDEKFVTKRPATPGGVREAYTLTKKGWSLLPVLSAIADWGLANLPGTEARLRPVSA